MLLPKPLKYASISGGMCIFGILFGWVMFPAILKSQLKKEMALSKKTDVREMWERIPFPLHFKIYIINYTNPEEVQNGATPIVKEVGPFYFEQWKEKVEVQEHEEDDTITYRKKDTFYFKPELSAPGLTGEEVVVVPHVFVISMITAVYREKPAMLNVVGKAINGIFDGPTDVFLRAKVLDIFFRGIVINCNRTEFAPKAACTAIKKENINGMVYEPNNQFRFSLFGTRNGSVDSHVVTVKRGIKNIKEVGSVVAIDGAERMSVWRDSCNEYDGTDNTIFPPFLTANDRLKSFSGDLCRSFKPWFQKKTSYKGIKTNRYIVNIGDFANDPELNCFCDAPDKCPPKGIMDMSKCMKAPLYLSLPHFLDCDPAVMKGVKGLHPDVNEHGIVIDFEPISGTPMVANQRIQFNIQLLQSDKLELTKNLPNTIVPIFWIDEGLALNKTFVKMMKKQLFIPKRIVGVMSWSLVSFGSLGALIGIVYHFKDDIMKIATSGDSNKVTSAKSDEEEQKDISVIGQAQEPAKINM